MEREGKGGGEVEREGKGRGGGGREGGRERAGEGPMSLSPPEMKSCVRPWFDVYIQHSARLYDVNDVLDNPFPFEIPNVKDYKLPCKKTEIRLF